MVGNHRGNVMRSVLLMLLVWCGWSAAWSEEAAPCHDGVCVCRGLSDKEAHWIQTLRHEDGDRISQSAHLTATEWTLIQERRRNEDERKKRREKVTPTETKSETWDDLRKREQENERAVRTGTPVRPLETKPAAKPETWDDIRKREQENERNSRIAH